MNGAGKHSSKERGNGLTPAQISELRAELEGEKKRLERALKSTSSEAAPVQLDQTSVGRLSRIDALQNQQLSAAVRGREQAKYAEVLNALDRIEKGTYGSCTRCGSGIPFGRLLVMPEARTCASC